MEWQSTLYVQILNKMLNPLSDIRLRLVYKKGGSSILKLPGSSILELPVENV